MKSLVYILIKSVIQGLYKGTLFFTAIFILFMTSTFFSGNYFLITSLSDIFNFNAKAMSNLSSLNSRVFVFYITTVLISILLVIAKNILERKGN